jgi:hypothetical protein
MQLLSGTETRRLDVELDVLSPNVFTGVYPWTVQGKKVEALNFYPTSTSPKLKYVDALLLGVPDRTNYLFNGMGVKAYGIAEKPYNESSPNNSYLNQRYTGQFAIDYNATRYDTCHAWLDHTKFTGAFNFYHAFHPNGYYSPPFGELVSLSEFVDEGASLSSSNGSCADITNSEYMQMMGIVTVNYSNSPISKVNDPSTTLAGKIAPIDSPYEECPPQAQNPYYFEEIIFRYAAGTYDGGVVGNPYNHNPLPTSLDYVSMQLTSRYNITTDLDDNEKIGEVGGNINDYMVDIANYGTGISAGKQGINNELGLNNKISYRGLCSASDMEGGTFAGVYQGGSLDLRNYDPAMPLNAGSIAPTFTYNGWNYWNFTFKENHDYLPFSNNFNSSSNTRSSSRGTQLLWAKKADTDHWWENRQCPEVVDFLPWTLGGTIYDCPRDYFEIPYYSLIGKFGYLGTRFQVSCKKLIREVANDVGGLKLPIPVYEVPYPMSSSENDPDIEPDGGGASSNFYFDGLLDVAKREQNYSEWLVTNKAPKLAYNYPLIIADPDYNSIIAQKPQFASMLYSFTQAVNSLKHNLPNYLTGTDSPYIKAGSDYEEDYSFLRNRATSDANLDNEAFQRFYTLSSETLGGGLMPKLSSLLDKYGFFFKSSANVVDWAEYNRLLQAKEERLRTRAFLNVSYGNPIDLYPTNHITYSFDRKNDYQHSLNWARTPAGSKISSSLNGGLDLPNVERRYFEGAYSKKYDREIVYQKVANIMELSQLPISLSLSANAGYSDGAFYSNTRCGATLPLGTYFPVTGGNGIKDSQNPSAIGSVNNWQLLGYNEIGAIDGNFSCFTPVFVQQPKNTYCKLGQSPTFRALALDYHTIPEDKIKIKHPEIWYWASKLKLVDNAKNYLYPMQYRWGRVRISNVANFMKGNFDDSTIEWASNTGNWGFLEGENGPTCTFIHPLECVSIDGNAGYFSSSRDSYKFLQGVKTSDCTDWAYFCLATGRFGVRCSDLFLIEADKFLLLDLAYINGGGASLTPEVRIELVSTVNNSGNGGNQTGGAQSFALTMTTPTSMAGVPFNGIKNDPWVIPEEVVIKQKYMRAGGGQNVTFGFNGDYMFRGYVRSYAPETITDTRGLRSVNHQPVDYGILLNYKLTLTDYIGACLYGYQHLPNCRNSAMAQGEKGVRMSIKVDGQEMQHPLTSKPAEIPYTNPPAPVTQGRVGHLGQLYNFDYPTTLAVTTSWQFHQNLGAIKRFGKATEYSDKGRDFVFASDRSAVDPAGSQAAFDYVKDQVVTSTELAGVNCGYTPVSVGRKMLYYVEAFERFYILCDSKAKYNVPNKSFIAPGLRIGDAPMQYAWFGQPSDTYLERRNMYGPYAFHWKVKRHNRDRLGNGITQGLWSMGWREKYTMMYDLAAVYGLYLKNTSQTTKNIVQDINTLRNLAFPNQVPPPRRIKLGRRGNQAEGYGYGDVRFDCDTVLSANSVQGVISNPSSASFAETICAYFSAGSSSLINSSEYYCGLEHVQNGTCFDPCLSMRYSHGFLPGGKIISHMSAGAVEDATGTGYKKTHRITQNGEDVGNGTLAEANFIVANDDLYVEDKRTTGGNSIVLRGPAFTPYAKKIKNGDVEVATAFSAFSAALQNATANTAPVSNRLSWSISPCEPGGAEHCNFITPTVHVGGNLPIYTSVTALTSNNASIMGAII